MIAKHLKTATIFAALAVAGSSSAATFLGETTISLFTRSVNVKSYSIKADLGPGLAQDAEGLAFYGGKLYVATDHNSSQGNGKLGIYETNAAGELGSNTVLNMDNRPDTNGKWGPEGMTFNTSGKGYGAFAPGSNPVLVTTDSNGDNTTLLVDAVTGAVSKQKAIPDSPDDIAYIASIDKFGLLADMTGSTVIKIYSHDDNGLTDSTLTIDVPALSGITEAKGLVALSAVYANWLLGRSDLTGQVLMTASKVPNELAFFGLDGSYYGKSSFLSVISGASEIEALAFDEANSILYIGDEDGFAVHSINLSQAVPEPSSMALLGLGAIALMRRRRK